MAGFQVSMYGRFWVSTEEPVTARGLCVSGWNLSKIRGCVYLTYHP